jgi:hypothetical protein
LENTIMTSETRQWDLLDSMPDAIPAAFRPYVALAAQEVYDKQYGDHLRLVAAYKAANAGVANPTPPDDATRDAARRLTPGAEATAIALAKNCISGAAMMRWWLLDTEQQQREALQIAEQTGINGVSTYFYRRFQDERILLVCGLHADSAADITADLDRLAQREAPTRLVLTDTHAHKAVVEWARSRNIRLTPMWYATKEGKEARATLSEAAAREGLVNHHRNVLMNTAPRSIYLVGAGPLSDAVARQARLMHSAPDVLVGGTGFLRADLTPAQVRDARLGALGRAASASHDLQIR